MDNVYNQRLEKLAARRERDTQAAVGWLDRNKGMFQHPVYKPVILTVSFQNILHFVYIVI